MVEQELPKLTTRVRFPSPAPIVTQLSSWNNMAAGYGSFSAYRRRRIGFAIAYGNALWSQRRTDRRPSASRTRRSATIIVTAVSLINASLERDSRRRFCYGQPLAGRRGANSSKRSTTMLGLARAERKASRFVKDNVDIDELYDQISTLRDYVTELTSGAGKRREPPVRAGARLRFGCGARGRGGDEGQSRRLAHPRGRPRRRGRLFHPPRHRVASRQCASLTAPV